MLFWAAMVLAAVIFGSAVVQVFVRAFSPT